jgi:hypothetical protein
VPVTPFDAEALRPNVRDLIGVKQLTDFLEECLQSLNFGNFPS